MFQEVAVTEPVNKELSMISRAISPLDGRYFDETNPLRGYFSEWALMKNRVRIELEWLITMSGSEWVKDIRNLTKKEILFLRNLVDRFDDSSLLKIKEIERTTNHDVKAVEYYLRAVLKSTSMVDVIEFIHFGGTSEDINTLSYALMLRDGIKDVWIGKAEEMVNLVSQAAKDFRSIPVVSRTHGQSATPTTVGKELAIFVYRWQRQLTYYGEVAAVDDEIGPRRGGAHA